MLTRVKRTEELREITQQLQKQGKKIAFTNGCFDLLHIGHVCYLRKAKASADILIVAINSDQSVKSLKGENRPIIEEQERAEVVAALEMVDFVTLFQETTCSHLLGLLKPDIYVKGGDYNPENLPEWQTVQEYGGDVKFINLVEGRSTSDIINKIKRGL